MDNNHAISALSATIDDLQGQLKEALTTKNVLAIQLTAEQQTNQQLSQKVAELEALLDQQTQPKNEEVTE